MARGRRRHRRQRGEPRAHRRRSAAADRRPRRRWSSPLIAALAAVPVGLGLAASLVLAAAAPQGQGQSGTAASGALSDDQLPPAASGDDFFPQDDRDDASPAPDDEPSPERPPQAGAPAQADGTITAPASPESGESPDASPDTPDRPADPAPGGGSGASALAQEVVTLTNAEREAAGCGPMRVDDDLTQASQLHSEDMAERDYMAHDTPEGIGPAERALEAGYTAWSGENVAAGYTSAEAVMEGWMNSPGHRANILNCDNTAIGVGESDARWAQNFGRE
ncbi:CAP domain-containing protein [Nocardiopsis sediminis]|uniref:CAP domain-containing protein n=1 Tax=Nocardiopsis sediminis TaxID=1778267 RepID=A0ABV8FJH2_9ACTN